MVVFVYVYIYFLVYFFYNFSPIYARKVMSYYIRNFPGEIHSQGWQGGLIATTRDENFWGG